MTITLIGKWIKLSDYIFQKSIPREIGPFLGKFDCSEIDVERLLYTLGTFRGNVKHEARRKEMIDSFSAIMEPHGKRHLFE